MARKSAWTRARCAARTMTIASSGTHSSPRSATVSSIRRRWRDPDLSEEERSEDPAQGRQRCARAAARARAGLLGLSEAGEVVVLETRGADGAPRHTRLWIVEDGGHAWLRGGQQGSAWIANLRANP